MRNVLKSVQTTRPSVRNFIICVFVFTSRILKNERTIFNRNGHMLTHRNKKPYECKADGCGKSYCDARSLRRHSENHHSSLEMMPVITSQAPTTELVNGKSISLVHGNYTHFNMINHRQQIFLFYCDLCPGISDFESMQTEYSDIHC